MTKLEEVSLSFDVLMYITAPYANCDASQNTCS